jgi:hypothetical protein
MSPRPVGPQAAAAAIAAATDRPELNLNPFSSMNSMFQFSSVKWALATAVALLAGFAPMPVRAADPTTPATPPTTAQSFGSPEEALKALVAATKAGDHAALDAIFGPDVKELLSGDPKQDAIEFADFSTKVGQFSHLVKKADDRYVLNLGDQNWPFPIPLVKRSDGWIFDTAAGKEEILNRRIGEDELTAIGVCRTYLAAQREYASEDRVGDGVLRFAQRIKSTVGKKDGLYWETAANEAPSPFGPLIAEEQSEGYGGKTAEGKPQPFHGYRFKILKAQGTSAPGGAYDYIINGNMIGGFALVAYPEHWGESGMMTFIVNQWGKVYERNLGDHSADYAAAMTEFDPDKDWSVVTQ